MPVEVALPVSYNRSYNNMPVLPLGTSKRRISDTSTYTSGSLASRRQIRQTLLERSTSLSSPTSSNAVGSSYSRFTSYQSSSIRSLPSGPGPLDSSGKRLDPVYLENLRRGRFEVMSPSSSRSSSLPPSRLTRRESVIEISSSLKRDKEILLRSRDTTSPFRSADFIREGSIKRELDSFHREGSVKRDMESFRRGRSVEPIMYKREESYRMERESSVSRYSNFSSNNLASTLGRTKRTQSITDLTSGLDNKRVEDSNANSRYLDTLNSSIHDPYGTLPRRSRFRTESIEREERSLSRSRISESPLRSSRISESPARTRVNESPSRTRISESPSRTRISESPSRVRLSETPSRSLLLDSSVSRSYLNESSLTRNLINESSPTKSIKNDSSSVRGFKNDNLSTRTFGKDNLTSRNITNDKSSRTLTNDISLAHSIKDDVSPRSFKSESLSTQKVNHSVKDDVSPRSLKSDSSSTQKSTNENLSNRNFKTDTSSARNLTNDSSSSRNFKNETSSSWSSKNDASSVRNLKNETSSVCNLKNDSSSIRSSKNENLSARDIKNEGLSTRSSKNDSSSTKSLKTDTLSLSSKNENSFSSKKLDSLPPSSKNESTFSSKKTDNLSSSSKNETSASPKIINDTPTWTSKKDKPSTHDIKNENLSTWSSKNDSASTKSLKSENSPNWSPKSENSLTPNVKSETSTTWSLKNDISTAKSLKTDRSSSWSSKNDVSSNRNLKAEISSSWSSKNDNLPNCNLKTDGLLPNSKNENISQTLTNDNSLSRSLKNDTSTHITSNDISSTCSLKTETSYDHKNDSSSNLKNDNLSSQNSTRILKNDNSVSACINESTSRPRINENAIRSTTAEIPPRPRVNETPSRPRVNDIAARPPRISDSPLRAKITDVTTTKYDINHNTTTVTSPTKLLPKTSSDYGSLSSYYSTKKDRFSSLSGSSDDGYDSKTSRSSVITNGKPESISSLSSRNEYNTIKSSNTSKETGGLVGLRNLGNTCFMNSVIQCLSNTESILDYCLRDSFVSDLNTSHSSMKGALTKAFAGLLQSLWKDSVSTSVSPHMFKQQIQKFAPRFMGYSQQDAQEFLRCLLQGLHEDVNRVTGKPKPIAGDIDEKLSDGQKATEAWKRYLHLDDSKIVDLFVGQLKSTLKCTTCGHSSVTFDPFWDLSLPIPKSYGTVTLQECLNLFTKEEILDGDEKPTCSRCKKRERCLKSLTIQRFPKMLVIHLKRFSQERYRAKLTTLVDFPVNNLDLSNYAADKRGIQKATYNLYAVANHSGTTYGGHYTAYCKNPRTGEWYDFNDTTVTMVSSSSDIIGPEAYLLFYEMLGTNSHL